MSEIAVPELACDLRLTRFRMPQKSTPCNMSGPCFACAVSIAIVMFLVGPGLMTGQAQVPAGFINPYSPFVTIPWFQGEVRVTPIWMGVESGKNTFGGHSWDLRHTFNLTRNCFALDAMVRVQVGPLSLRINGEQRDFVGTVTDKSGAVLPKKESHLEFSGYRSGLDFDFLNRCGARAGVNADYYWYSPFFTEAVITDPHYIGNLRIDGKRISGGNPWTVGIHAACTVPRQFFGAWPVFEARVRWPLKIYTSPEITDLELAAGLRGPGTVLGGLAVRGGYRRTSITFQDAQIYHGVPTQSNFNAVLSGWFGELVYYY